MGTPVARDEVLSFCGSYGLPTADMKLTTGDHLQCCSWLHKQSPIMLAFDKQDVRTSNPCIARTYPASVSLSLPKEANDTRARLAEFYSNSVAPDYVVAYMSGPLSYIV
jgi:hypothetical protein